MNPLQPLVTWLAGVFAIVKNWVTPLLTIIIPLATPVAVLVEAVRNPEGWVNEVMCRLVDMIGGVLPEMPQGMTLAGLISSAGVEGFGAYVIGEILSAIAIIVSVDIIIKIWKWLPFT
ncbi:hypothetical protein WEU38_11900 [Cyanobacterium aponinum AL20118]|uniref:Uncharacterized protein n=1 Tax=Cyanobacterium aponinum AL20115 TaxID=3090662 RepID=A0AAF0Z8T9_9CHRO|nr:hypothetical protein [Cyanobacterium aponinum]WPF87513.1 hypothetical protein SAY89_11930 [Cyanobacterium aponinum AL20115]